MGVMYLKFMKINEFFKNYLALLSLIMVVFVILSITLFSYAYFTANVQGEGKQITISTGDAVVHFTDNNVINETGITPGTTVTKTFYVTNTSSGSLKYKINWEYLLNTFLNREYLKYTMTSTNGGGSLSSTQVPDSEDHINIIDDITIPGNTTQTYTMTITYEDRGQGNVDINSSVIGKLEIVDRVGHSITAQTTTGTYNGTITSNSSLYGISMGRLIKQMYPVGSLYTSTDSTDPSELFPGTVWERYGKGKTLVGVDESDTTFNSAGKTGGVKDAVIPYHRHELNGTNAKAASAGTHTHDVSGSTTTNGAHTHTIAANGIQVKSTAQTISTAVPNEVTGEYEDGVNYGEHTHIVTGTGKNTNTVTIANSGNHTHTTTASTTNGGTADGGHTHTAAANQISVTNTTNYTIADTNSNHTHTTTAKTGLTTGSESSHTHSIAAATYNGAALTAGAHTHSVSMALNYKAPQSNAAWSTEEVGGISGSGQKMAQINKSGVLHYNNTVNVTQASKGAHTPNVTIPEHTTLGGSAHSHTFSIPALDIASSGAHTHTIPSRTLTSNNSSAIRIPGTNTTDGAHTHAIPALDIASSGAHTHNIPANAISFSLTSGSTSSDNHAGAHIHDIKLPALTSKNASAVTATNTGSGHTHTVSGTAASAGAHTHSISGYTQYAGTSGNATNANLQPYVTVYMWKRIS